MNDLNGFKMIQGCMGSNIKKIQHLFGFGVTAIRFNSLINIVRGKVLTFLWCWNIDGQYLAFNTFDIY